MVKEIEGYGDYTRNIEERLGIPFGFRTIHFDRNDPMEALALARLSEFNLLDQRSWLFRGVSNGDNRQVDVLVVPRSCPNLLPERYPPTEALPSADETYFARTWHYRTPERILELLVLQSDSEKAERIARRKTSIILGCSRKDVEMELILLDPQDWLTVAKRLIGQGRNLPPHITKYGGLARRAYPWHVA